ncbi:MAG: hypothetical protein GF320_02995, partial [Armatimonadia bacterium]|nr:hypothetical protein [Armatimonadia bacterium]
MMESPSGAVVVWVALTFGLSGIPADAQPAGAEWVTEAVSMPGLRQTVYESEAAGCPVSFHVYTPPVYAGSPDTRLPVLYWLHGHGGGVAGLRPLVRYFGAAMADGEMPPAVIVFPNGLAEGMWCDSVDGSTPVETILMDEIIPMVDAGYRTIASREGRLIEGFSMGGHGAARLGFKYPDIFATVSILAGGPLTAELESAPGKDLRTSVETRTRILESVYGGDQAAFRERSPWTWAERKAQVLRKGSRIRVVLGTRDDMQRATAQFSEHLATLGIPHCYSSLPDLGHEPIAVLRALGFGLYWQAFDQPGDTPLAVAGMHSVSLWHDERSRTYLAYVPKSPSPVPGYPIVMMLHGGGGNARAAMYETRWPAAAEAHGFIAVFPEGTRERPEEPASFLANQQTWNDGSPRPTLGAVERGVDDVALIVRVLEDVGRRFPMDDDRIHATGFSNGASMVFRLARDCPGLLASIAPVAGCDWLSDQPIVQPIPLLYITGAQDPLNPIEGGELRIRNRSYGIKQPVHDTIESWAAAMGVA